jgi:predicted tellurium resistance membrane protein TerC
MRFVAQGFLGLVKKYPTIVDGAYMIVGWVGAKLVIEYLHKVDMVGFTIPQWVSLVVILSVFAVSFLISRRIREVRRVD